MRTLNVFRDWTRAGGQLGFYTKYTKDRIPPVDGCYAWFLPLWIYREDLEQQLDVLDRLFRYDPDPERQVDAVFNWEASDSGCVGTHTAGPARPRDRRLD